MAEGHNGLRADEHGLAVLHLFCSLRTDATRDGLSLALKRFSTEGHELVTVALLGHRADLGLVAIAPTFTELRELQTAVRRAGAQPEYSYVSVTEVSEYAAGVPDELRRARLNPHLPPAGLRAFCFYPMSKARQPGANWYELGFDERLALMYEHGTTGRTYRGRVLQLITGSSGLDDYEWGVTLFGDTPERLKQCVYEMRYDRASARYGEFGPFLAGTVDDPDTVLRALGL